jgi:putative ABC transport system substrate-binding protein
MRYSRRAFLRAAAASSTLVALSACAAAPAPPKVYRVGWLLLQTQAASKTQIDAFRGAMRDLGYDEGRNYSFEVQEADGRTERLATLAAAMVAQKFDTIVSRDTNALLALKQATTSIPIVMDAGSTDPVGDGLVSSFARPGGNITGTAAKPMNTRRLQLLKQAVPAASRVAYLVDAGLAQGVRAYQEALSAAPAIGIELVLLEVRAPEDFAAAFATASRARADAIQLGASGLISNQRTQVLSSIAASRLPSITGSTREWVDGGALIYYGTDLVDQERLTAKYVDRILKGANPADLPIDLPTGYELIINMKTAKTLGLTIPPSVMAQVTELIGN